MRAWMCMPVAGERADGCRMSVASATAASLGLSSGESMDNVTVERTNIADGTVARITPLESPIDAMQRELDQLRTELNAIRRRDDMLQFYMHRLDEELKLAARVQQDFLPRACRMSAGCSSTRSSAPPRMSAATSTT